MTSVQDFLFMAEKSCNSASFTCRILAGTTSVRALLSIIFSRGGSMDSAKSRGAALRLLAVIGLFFVITAVAFGQALNFGSFIGTVRDPSGAGVPQVKVRLIQSATNTVRETTTGADGTYRILDVPAGTYNLEFEREGFTREIRNGVAVSADRRNHPDHRCQRANAGHGQQYSPGPIQGCRGRHDDCKRWQYGFWITSA